MMNFVSVNLTLMPCASRCLPNFAFKFDYVRACPTIPISGPSGVLQGDFLDIEAEWMFSRSGSIKARYLVRFRKAAAIE